MFVVRQAHHPEHVEGSSSRAGSLPITVQLPEFLPQIAAFEATADGLVPLSCEVTGGKAVLKLGSIESGRVFVLRRK